MHHANYMIRERTDEHVLIEDIGPHDICATITNDAEFVVGELLDLKVLRYGMRLLYIDSQGRKDEILWEGRENSCGFRPLPQEA